MEEKKENRYKKITRMTTRNFDTRVKEHRHCMHGSGNSEFANHLMEEDHTFKTEDVITKHMSLDNECADGSSDYNVEFSDAENYDYLHEKIGIYVKDHSGSSRDKSQLVQLLPAEFSVVIVSYSDEERCDKVPGFSCTLRLSIWEKETILRWLKLFEQKTYTVWRVDSTFKCEKSKKLIFKKNFRCQNNQYNHPNRNKENTRKKRVEHTACPAKISLTIKNRKMQRTSDVYLKEYPTVINIRFTHNHTFKINKEYLTCAKPADTALPEINKARNFCVDTRNSLELTEPHQNTNTVGKTLAISEIEDKKCGLANTDWSDICEDVFGERTSQSMCVEKANENVMHYTEVTLLLDSVCSIIKQKLAEKPNLYQLPVLKFINTFDSLKTDSQLVAALNAFGINSTSDVDYKVNSESGNTTNELPVAGEQSNKFYETYKIEKDDGIFLSAVPEHSFLRLT